MVKTKPFGISKRAVWEAYRRVRKNGGAAGVDRQSLEEFERDLGNNLYKLWNRLASGSYFPPPVRQVEIPKAQGGTRTLGIPTVADRIAQMVVKQAFEPCVESYFHRDSYGYRPGKSALQAVGVTRQRCWQYDYVLEFDIKWMERDFPHNPFVRYADDGVVHCRGEAQAYYLKHRLEKRFRECMLELHPRKTQIVCCRVGEKQDPQVSNQFDFLGYCFRPRLVRSRSGQMFVGFTPAISPQAAKRIRQRVRRWRLHRLSGRSLEDLAQEVNPVIQGWMNYYGAYQRSALVPILRHIDQHLVKWVKRKYKKRRSAKRAMRWLGQVASYHPGLFVHWRLSAPFPAE